MHVTVPDQHDVEPALGAEFTLPPRAGVVVSKAVGNAVVRNKVKRRLRHLVSERLHTLPAGATLVVRAQPSAALRSYAELASDIDAALTVARSPRRPRPKGAR